MKNIYLILIVVAVTLSITTHAQEKFLTIRSAKMSSVHMGDNQITNTPIHSKVTVIEFYSTNLIKIKIKLASGVLAHLPIKWIARKKQLKEDGYSMNYDCILEDGRKAILEVHYSENDELKLVYFENGNDAYYYSALIKMK